MHSKFLAVTASSMLAVSLLAGCGKNDVPGAQAAVCDARTNLQSSFQKVADDLQAGNLGDAKTSLAAVTANLATLVAAQQGLAQDKKDQIKPKLDAIKSTLISVGSANSMAEAGAILDTAKAQMTDLVDTVGTSAGCQ
jgi:hypothetical protein